MKKIANAGSGVDMKEMFNLFAMKIKPDNTIIRLENLEKKCLDLEIQVNM